MKRDAIEQLQNWKKSPIRKPLLLLGARQVGKTWLMQEFGRRYYKKVAYIRFDLNERLRASFEQDYDINRLLEAIQLDVRFKITPKDTLIIFDEIQECPRALTSLKYFCEEAREYHVIAAGSLLGLFEHKGTGFPVGKVDIIHLYPMTYCEFLDATGNELYAEALQRKDWRLVTDFASRYIDLLKLYYVVGGMPEAVKTYVETQDYALVRQVQDAILMGYQRDFSKHAPAEETPRISLIWDSIPEQLARENKKFMCSSVQHGMRSRDLEVAMQWLMDAGLIYKVARISKPAFPPDAYREAAFKAFFLDVGLLGAKTKLPVDVILDGNRIFTEFKGALAEQYVQQQLRAACSITPYYWATSNSQTEIDFLVQMGLDMVPLEVKAETNLQSKSLKAFCKKFRSRRAMRVSMAPWCVQEMPIADDGTVCQLINLPLYAVHLLPSL
ncbi:MAG: ATP-binding protein [Akkermansia sp.]|nr:ATP-binding protein [Akkermansia sp.]